MGPAMETAPQALGEITLNRHFEADAFINASDTDVFAFVDGHAQLSGHMTKASWMMGGGRMDMAVDSGRFQQLGSHLRLTGRAFGASIFLDEVVTRYQPPGVKTWETVGVPKLLVIGEYRMGLSITPEKEGCTLRIFIDYDIPKHGITRVLGYFFASIYARWCVRSMLRDVRASFVHPPG
jgi:hypothetical protein